MLEKFILLVKEKLPSIGDKLSDLSGYAAVRVPLDRASGPNEVTLDLPGYAQVNSFCCGVVAGVMVLKHFRPSASFSRFYDRVNPKENFGAGTGKIARALRESGLRVKVRSGLIFDDLCAAIDDRSPIMVNVHNPGAEDDHWVVVYGYGREPNRVFIATNGMPVFKRNAIPLRKFARMWSPHGNGLVCERARPSARRAGRRSARK